MIRITPRAIKRHQRSGPPGQIGNLRVGGADWKYPLSADFRHAVRRRVQGKVGSAGGWLAGVAAQDTSQTCSGCGWRPELRLTLAIRTFGCADCGLVLDLDVDAATKVRERAFGPLPGGDSPAGAAQDIRRLK